MREHSRIAHHLNSRQTKQTATNQQHATGQGATDKQTVARTHCDAISKTPHQKQGNPANAPASSTVTGCPDTAYATNATTPSNHTPHRVCSLAARNALITAQPQVKGNHPNTPQQGSAPTQTTRRAAQAWPRQGKERSPRPARQSKGGEAPTDRGVDPGGQQGTRTPPTQCERTD